MYEKIIMFDCELSKKVIGNLRELRVIGKIREVEVLVMYYKKFLGKLGSGG